jgi:hypothetical protein
LEEPDSQVMPVPAATFPSAYDFVFRATAGNSSLPANASAPHPLEVICAWPVSGQYGVGSRFLFVMPQALLPLQKRLKLTWALPAVLNSYYVLVIASVVARKHKLLRDACLAAALLFPAIAAFHGIVLAAVHINGTSREPPLFFFYVHKRTRSVPQTCRRRR